VSKFFCKTVQHVCAKQTPFYLQTYITRRNRLKDLFFLKFCYELNFQLKSMTLMSQYMFITGAQ